VLYNLLLILCRRSLPTCSKGAIGKCTSLFKFVEGTIKERVGQSQSQTIAHAVDSAPASSMHRISLRIDAELRKRRVDDNS
jgi:hypothetical protein